ncbi:MAG: hypothetical protein QG653_66 [Patescibacteria group bacterium]|nr:hypothetical protein [Patescibacteria group bacterium]
MQSRTLIALIIGSVTIGVTYFMVTYKNTIETESINDTPKTEIIDGSNVVMEDGKQIINLFAKGGYQPRVSIAKAGVPTILRVTTSNTFDCSSALRIPSLKIAKNLQYSGSVDIDLGSPEAGAIDGLCSMAMYRFQLQFKD